MPATTTGIAAIHATRTAVHTARYPSWGEVRIIPLVPEEDAGLIHSWVTEERARFWGMLGHSREQVLEIYRFVESLETHHAFLVTLEGEAVALFQSYEPLHDPVGETYPARAEDVGVHLLLAPATRPIPFFTPSLVNTLVEYLFTDPAIDRIVVEPDIRNDKALRRMLATGFEAGPVITLAEKEAQLAFLKREVFEGGRAEAGRRN